MVKRLDQFPPVTLASPLLPFNSPQQNVTGLARGGKDVRFVPPQDFASSTGGPQPTMASPSPDGNVERVASEQAFAFVTDISFDTLQAQSTKFLDQSNVARNLLALRNASAAANIYIGFGNQASDRSTFKLVPGAIIQWDSVVPQDDLYYYADAAAGILCVAFSTFNPNWRE